MQLKQMSAFVLLAGIGLGMAAGVASAQEKGLVFAHRGGAHEFEENTMDAFRGSYAKGLRGFETDIRMTQDGELVILHDETLDRTHDATGPVEQKTAAELREIKSKKSGQSFLFLSELLEFFADKPGVYLEFEMKVSNKSAYPDARLKEFVEKLHTAVKAQQPKDSIYVFTSFDERPLRLIKAMDPQADLLFITGGPCTPEFVKRAKEIGVNRIGVKMEGTSRVSVQAAQKAGLRVTGWPGHSRQDYHLAMGLGMDAFCTDIPVEITTWLRSNP